MCTFPNFWFRMCCTGVFLTVEENYLTGGKKSSEANLPGTKMPWALSVCTTKDLRWVPQAEKHQVVSDAQCFYLTIKGHCLVTRNPYWYANPEKQVSIFQRQVCRRPGPPGQRSLCSHRPRLPLGKAPAGPTGPMGSLSFTGPQGCRACIKVDVKDNIKLSTPTSEISKRRNQHLLILWIMQNPNQDLYNLHKIQIVSLWVKQNVFSLLSCKAKQ